MSNIPNSSRFEKKQEQRRKGILLNGMLGIVLLIALTVAYQLFTSSPEQAATKKNNAEQKEDVNKGQLVVKDDNKKSDEVETKPAENKKVAVPEQLVAGVQEAYTNPSWAPVGTSQSGTHTTQFDSNSQDWKEMIQAISYATEVPADSLTILFIGNNGANKAIGTVQAKTTKQKYKVYIEWVDNEGWKPTLVQVMK